MAKRGTTIADGAAAFRKRQKLTHDAPTGEDVTSSDQLRKLLSFDQDLQRARHGLQSFKKLLDDLSGDTQDREAKIAILSEYLEAVKPKHPTEDAVYLSDIMEMWSFAVQLNNEGVMSSAVVVLALLLHFLSGSLPLVAHGFGICQTLLQERQLKSMSRNLGSDKSKAFIISPTLRMLREVVSIDGGAFAKRVFRARSATFTSLGRNLEIGLAPDSQEDPRKASVRTNAVRFLLSCIKFLHSDGRRELLAQKDLLSHLTFMIKSDPPYLVVETLETLKAHVLMDEKLARESKFRSFNTKTLLRILALYNYGSGSQSDEERSLVSERTHDFLIHACTSPGAGILYPSTGLYPKPAADESRSQRLDGKKAGLDGASWETNFQDGVPVFNFVLSEFAQKLRPWSNIKHSELLVAIFSAAPELIADYFYNNRSFTFEPKISMTWIGYASFLFNTMQIPLPSYFGDRTRYHHVPPPTSIILDNILPLPINLKAITRCLSPNSHLTSFFITRILVLALDKLAKAIEMHQQSRAKNRTAWSDAERALVDGFCRRIPDMKEIVRSYKTIPADHMLHKAMASRLLRLYYEVIPRVALAANFDVSPLFVDVLQSLDGDDDLAEAKAFGVIELESLVSVASHSPGMKWFSKTDKLSQIGSCSPFTALLRLLCADHQDAPSDQIRSVLDTVAVENQLVSNSTGIRALLQSLRCLQSMAGSSEAVQILLFLDNCISRCTSTPIKYLETAASYLEQTASASQPNISLVNAAIVEQLPYALGASSADGKNTLGRYLALYFHAAITCGENEAFVRALYAKVTELFAAESMQLKDLGTGQNIKLLDIHIDTFEETNKTGQMGSATKAVLSESQLRELLDVPPSNGEDTSTLTKWMTRNAEDLVEDGWAANLVRLLTSDHVNIRKEAVTNILKMAAKIKDSAYEEKDQVWLLLCEVAESSRVCVDTTPVPSAFTSFATHALEVLRNPLHPLYPKVNSFLTRGPVWSLEKLPLAHDILHGEPSEDDRYYTEVAWLLTYLVDSLATPFDLGVFHKKRWFEKVLALGSNPYMRSNLRTKILRVVYRATCIKSGSTTLVTRFGIISWLDAQRASSEVRDDAIVYEGLMKRVWDTCDQQKVAAWSRGGVPKLILRATSSSEGS